MRCVRCDEAEGCAGARQDLDARGEVVCQVVEPSGVEHGETFADAAIRELREETGLREAQVSGPISDRRFSLQLADGEHVFAIEQYFVVDAETDSISREGWTAEEIEVMAAHKWWSREELVTTTEIIYPDGLIEMLDEAGVFGA